MRPIMFKTDEIRAILDDKKTTKRFVVKPANPFRGRDYCQGDGLWIDGYNEKEEPNGHIKDYSVSSCWWPKKSYIEKYSPYKPGNILYVQETWCRGRIDSGELLDGREELFVSQCKGEDDFIPKEYAIRYGIGIEDVVWNSPILMPKEEARIFLRVKAVKIEKLQSITEEQAVAEGAIDNRGFIHSPSNEYDNIHTAREHFKQIWNSSIKKPDLDRYGWNVNPWVWVVEFEKCEKPEN